MGPVLFLLIFVAVTVFLAMRGRAKRTGESDQRQTVLEALVPLVGGTVSKDGELTGQYQGYAISAEMGTSTPPGLSSGASGNYANVLRVHIMGASLMTGQAWQFRNTGGSTQPGGHWRFLEPGQDFPFGRALSRAADVPMPDPQLESRLREGGIGAALDRLPLSELGWLPDVAFAGAVGLNLVERYQRAGLELPPEAQEQAAQVGGLRIEVERPRFDDPRPEQFRQLLDAALGIIEINSRLNP